MFLSVIVPCFNEEKNVRPFYEKTTEILSDFIHDTELIFVDDGSTDATVQELRDIFGISPYQMKIIRFSRNFGKEAALLAGLEHATGEFTAIIDADLQQNPKYILDMLKILQEQPEYDCVAAYQAERHESKLLAFFKNCFYKLINKMTSVEFYRSASDFRLLRRNMVRAVVALPERCRFSKGIFSWVGFNTYYMPYNVEQRQAGKSKWNFWKLTTYAINGIVAFSDKPLIISSLLGLALFIIAIIMLLVVVIKTLIFGDPVAGFPTLASLILLLSGIQLLSIGIIGQYLAKVYTEAKGRPVYIIKEKLECQRHCINPEDNNSHD